MILQFFPTVCRCFQGILDYFSLTQRKGSHRLMGKVWAVLFVVRPVWVQSNRWKSVTHPDSGKCIAKSKGVHREVESEESWRQSSGLTNRNHMRLQLVIRLPYKLKSNNYSELTVVDVAGTWSERLRSYLGRSRQRMELHQQMHKKFVVTTNGEKSAEVIVPSWLQT